MNNSAFVGRFWIGFLAAAALLLLAIAPPSGHAQYIGADWHQEWNPWNRYDDGYGGGGGKVCDVELFRSVDPAPNETLGSLDRIAFTAPKETKVDSLQVLVNDTDTGELNIFPKSNGDLKVTALLDEPITTPGDVKITLKGHIDSDCPKAFTYFVTIAGTDGPPPTCSIYADPDYVYKGDSVLIRWQAQHATEADLFGSDVDPAVGELWITPEFTRTIGMTVFGPGGEGYCETTVVVAGEEFPEPWCEIWTTPSTVTYGDTVWIEWEAGNADGAWLEDYGYVAVPQSGEEMLPYNSRTYTLTVWNGQKSASCTTDRVQVNKTTSWDRWGWWNW